MNNKVPVKYNGVVVGYTIDCGKTIEFIDGAAEGKINKLLSQNQIIGVSARALGKVLDDNTVEKTEEISYDIIHYEGNQTMGSISNVANILGLKNKLSTQVADKLELNISSEFSSWIASLLERGLMEHQTSYGNMIPVPDEVINFIKEFYEHEQSR